MRKTRRPVALIIVAAAATLGGAGCSSSAPTAPTTGSLQITVTGLSGAPAAITVTGPSGYNRADTATTTLSGLAPGMYTVGAAAVVSANGTYLATPTSATVAVVVSDVPAVASVTYALITGALSVTVTGLPPGVPARVIVTGPNGFDQTATGSHVFSNLLAGAYAISANVVTLGTTGYAAVPLRQVVTVPVSLTPIGAIVTYSIGQPATHFSLSVPDSAIAGQLFDVTITALDASNAVAGTYSGKALFSSTDGLANLVGGAQLTNGIGIISATLNTVGNQSITAGDSADPSITGSSRAIVVSKTTGPAITSGQPPDGVVGFNYGEPFTLCASQDFPDYGFFLQATGRGRGGDIGTWSGTLMPPGLQVDFVRASSPGPGPCPHGAFWLIDGVPTAAGVFTFTLAVSNGLGQTSQQYTITISPSP